MATFNLTFGDDTFNGSGTANDTFTGSGGGTDSLNGGAGNDEFDIDGVQAGTIVGGSGDDAIVIQSGWNQLATSLAITGVETLEITSNNLFATAAQLSSFSNLTPTQDSLTEFHFFLWGAGDTLSFASRYTSTITLYVEAAQATSAVSITGTARADNLLGSDFNDSLAGGNGDDTLNGGAGADTLSGGAGADTLVGFSGDDLYIVDNVNDVVQESGGGHDTVRSSHSFSLAGQSLEDLTLTGTGVINGTGNSLANHLIGNGSANQLNGGTGADTMEGGAGDDTYVVDNAGDRVIEAGGGIDTVKSSISFSLAGQPIENLTLTGSTSGLHADGNSYDNLIFGNSAANQLNGMAGSDTLVGGDGSDYFLFNTALSATNVDTITDFSVVADTIRLENAVFTGLKTGTLASAAFHIGTAAASTTDRIIYDSATGKLFFDDDGTGVHAQKQFATISAHLSLTNADFQVV